MRNPRKMLVAIVKAAEEVLEVKKLKIQKQERT